MRNSIGTIYPFGYIRLEYSASTHETMTHCFSEQKKLFFKRKKCGHTLIHAFNIQIKAELRIVTAILEKVKVSNDQERMQSEPKSRPQIQSGETLKLQ